jgi:hypothetical protein
VLIKVAAEAEEGAKTIAENKSDFTSTARNALKGRRDESSEILVFII